MKINIYIKIIILITLLIFTAKWVKAQPPGCPQIDLGPDISASCNNPCINLNATVLETGQTNTYAVSSIPYAPPFPYTGGTPVSVNTDDVYSNAITLPFSFCFYGQAYNQVTVGSNGNISFDLTTAGGSDPWAFTASVPSSFLPLNAIFGAYLDIDPGVCGNLYYDITGSYPCRMFVFKFNAVCYFSCNSLVTSQEIVLYEGTNVVEVYIQDHPVCSTWNSGNAVIGIQDATGTIGITPPGRNTGPWITNNEAWRFTPSGPPNYTVSWYDQNATLIGTGLTTTVCPITTSVYTAQVVYQNCNGGNITASDQIAVNVSNSAYAGPDDSICDLNYTLNGQSSGPGSWTVTGPGIATIADNTDTISNVNVSNYGTYTFVWTMGTGSGACSDTALISFNEIPTASAGPAQTLCLLNTTMAAIQSIGIGTWTYTGPGTITFVDNHSPTTSVIASVEGQYVFTWTEVNGPGCSSSDNVTITFTQMPVANAGSDINVCQLNTTLAATPSVGIGTWAQTSGTGTINFTNVNDSVSSISTITTQGVYVLTWTEDNGNGCISSDQVQVTLSQTPIANAGTDAALCLLTYNLQATPSVGTGTWTYTGPGTATFNNSNSPTAITTVSANGIYTFTWTENNTNGCVDSDAVVITFTQMPSANAGTDINICQLDTSLAAIPSFGIGTWTVTSGPGILNINSLHTATSGVITNTQGVYNLTWTEDNGNGCIDSDNMVLTLTNQPIANAGIRDSVCSLTKQLNGTASFGTGTWSQLDGSGVSSFVNQHSATSSVTASLYGDYHFLWFEDNGNGCTDADTVHITFNYIPTSTFTVEPINCFGDDATVNYTGDGEQSAQYSWVFTNANVISGTSFGPYEIDYPNTGTNNILLTVTEHGCVSPITSIPVFNPPLLKVVLSKTDVTCNGIANGQVFTTVAGGTPNYNYIWSNGSVFPTIINASPNIYKVTVTDIKGCTAKDSITITEPPKLSIDMLHYISLCDGSDTTIEASATGGTFPYTFLWNTGSSTTSINVAPHVTTMYYVVVTDAHQCTSVSNVEVYVYPPLLLSVTQSTDSICPGESFVISPVASGGKGEPYSYFIDGNLTSVPATIFPNTQHFYQILVTDGCHYQAQTIVSVYVYPSPTNFPAYDKQAGCVPFTVTFNEESPDVGQTYLWDFGDGGSAYIKNPVHIYKQPGSFDVTLTVTSIYGCKIINYYQDWLTAYPLPIAQFEPEPSLANIIKPIVFFNNYSYLADSVRWFFGDGDSSSIYSPTHRYPIEPTGTYDVTLIVYTDKGCSDTTKGSIEIQDVVTFYAPTAFSPDNDGKNDTFLVFGNGIDLSTFQLFVFDRWGEVIFESISMEQGWNGTVKGNSKAPVGVYTWLVKFRDFKGIAHEKSGSVTVIR